MGWPLVVAGVVIGVVAVTWILGGRSPHPDIASAAASHSPFPSLGIAVAPSVSPTTLASSAPPTLFSGPPTERATARPTPTRQPTEPPTEPATPQPTEPPTEAPTLLPTQTPLTQIGALTIIFPSDGQVVTVRDFNIIGKGPPGATVTRDIPLWFDDHVTVGTDGTWLMPVSIGDGANVLTFRLGDDRSTERVITVNLAPGD